MGVALVGLVVDVPPPPLLPTDDEMVALVVSDATLPFINSSAVQVPAAMADMSLRLRLSDSIGEVRQIHTVRLWSRCRSVFKTREFHFDYLTNMIDGIEKMSFVQYVWGQYVMRNLGANSVRPLVDKFTNFMWNEPFSDRTTHSALEILSCIVARGLIFLPQNFAQLILDLCHSAQ